MIATDYEIRKITKEDIAGVSSLIRQFKEEALNKTMVSFDDMTLLKMINEAIEKGNPSIIVARDENRVVGMIAYVVIQSFYDENQIMALELMWYVSKDRRDNKVGHRLIEEAEKDCRAKGAESLIMVAGHYSENIRQDRALDVLYRRKGYKKLESHYIKNLRR